MMAGNFRYTVWDPWMILAQMATLQCWYYVSLGLWLFILEAITGYPRNLDNIFKYSSLFVSLSHGKVVVAAFIFNALLRLLFIQISHPFHSYLISFIFNFSSLALWNVVQRTKLCLDFTCTVHVFHVLICWYYNGTIASSFSWWVINTICVTLMCVSGEFLCMRTELRAIPISMGAKVDL